MAGRTQGMLARNPQGWGFADHAATPDERGAIATLLHARFPTVALQEARPRALGAPPAPRITPPPKLAGLVDADPATRQLHAVGRSYSDVVRAFHGEVSAFPDLVATPRDATEVAALLDWCATAGAACVPFGGGTSVVGGVDAAGAGAAGRPVVVLQTRAMRRVTEVDVISRAARIEAGASGPDVEAQLREHGLTARFFPQSFELSTVGGWVATRAAGHYATRMVHVDDLVESIEAVTPAGLWASRRLPGSGAGPSPDRLLLGSEGTLGVITAAWLRVQAAPVYRAGASVMFADGFARGAAAVRALAQSGLDPANCRLLDPLEAALNGAGDGTAAVLVLGFESAALPVDADLAAAVELCRDHAGVPGQPRSGDAADPATRWRRAFLRAPYLRDVLIALGVLSETFETAVTWDRLDTLVAQVRAATETAVREVCGDGVVTCRLTHAYPDGAAPYFTVIAPARRGAEVAQWAEIKAAASEALHVAGGTITHHHAVGRDHRRWYDRQRPDPFAVALGAAKHALDPGGILNPGVLLESAVPPRATASPP